MNCQMLKNAAEQILAIIDDGDLMELENYIASILEDALELE